MVRHDNKGGHTYVGGNGRYLDLMKTIVDSLFHPKEVDVHWTAANKVKVHFLSKPEEFDRAIKALEKNSFICTPLAKIGRIAR